MNDQRRADLGQIVDLSRQMLEHARCGGWERVAELEAQRREQVMNCFRDTAGGGHAAAETALIQLILRLNQELTELGRSHRDALGAELQQNKKGAAAHLAYATCAP